MRFVVCPLSSLPPGSRRSVRFGGRDVVVFNVRGGLFAVRDVCPHQGAPLSSGIVVNGVHSDRPGCYSWDPATPHIRCPWHGWEYDLTTGRSWSGPSRVRTFPVTVEDGSTLDHRAATAPPRPGPYVAETLSVSVEDEYVVIDDELKQGGR